MRIPCGRCELESLERSRIASTRGAPRTLLEFEGLPDHRPDCDRITRRVLVMADDGTFTQYTGIPYKPGKKPRSRPKVPTFNPEVKVPRPMGRPKGSKDSKPRVRRKRVV